jgi:hypothetical protein
MDESITLDIRFKSQAADDAILPEELELLESILPELILAMIQAEALPDAA